MSVTHGTRSIDGREHNYLCLGSQKAHSDTIMFSGANGFPVGTYESFLSQFEKDYFVQAVDCRATIKDIGPPSRSFGFAEFADDLINAIESLGNQPVIAMGHSFGAHVSLIASIKRPDLFKQLILIEPASLPNAWIDLIYRKLPKAIVHRILPMVKQTLERQAIWGSRREFIERYAKHRTFSKMTNQTHQAYAKYGLVKRNDNKFELVFDPRWEAHIFRRVEYIWNNLKKTTVPCLFIKAEKSNLYSSQLFNNENKKLGVTFSGIEVKDTFHLMPLEHPAVCYKEVSKWLSQSPLT